MTYIPNTFDDMNSSILFISSIKLRLDISPLSATPKKPCREMAGLFLWAATDLIIILIDDRRS